MQRFGCYVYVKVVVVLAIGVAGTVVQVEQTHLHHYELN